MQSKSAVKVRAVTWNMREKCWCVSFFFPCLFNRLLLPAHIFNLARLYLRIGLAPMHAEQLWRVSPTA